MKRLISKAIITMFLVTSLNGLAFADEDDVNFFLEKIATTNNTFKKAIGIGILENNLEDNGKFDSDKLKKAIKPHINEEDKKKLKDNGYTVDEALESLDVLDNMSKEEAEKLIKALEAQDLDGMKEIINNHTDDSSEEKEEGDGGGETPSTPEEEITETEEATTPEVEIPKVEFEDLDKHWAKEDIEFLAGIGIITGQDEGIFNPQGKITRAEFTALIVRLFDLKQNDKFFNISFKDVNNTDWYYEVAKIASEYGIINGVDEYNFAPNKEITREEMITIIMRALKDKNLEIGKNNISIDNFEDKSDISTWAVDNINEALKMNIIKGKTENVFDSKGAATRAEAATIIKRVYDLINQK